MVYFDAEDQALLLQESHIVSRLGIMAAIISREIEVMQLEEHINDRVANQLTNQQREMYLREKMRIREK